MLTQNWAYCIIGVATSAGQQSSEVLAAATSVPEKGKKKVSNKFFGELKTVRLGLKLPFYEFLPVLK